MYSDSDILKDVTAELKMEPGLRDDDIAVGVRDGVLTLAGYVDSYADKWRAERIAGRVKGVKALVNDLEVRLPSGSQRADPELARVAVEALKWNILVPHDRIQVIVEDGWITLKGEVDWFYQKEEAERTVRNLAGVKGVSNLITVAAKPAPSDIKKRITEALQRAAQFDAERITVEVDGHQAILRGMVRSYTELKDAERAARNAPGITEVENHLTVDPSVYSPV
ncbi:MAG TPA: BON domain-containing protein [Gemmatimonadales bacterium]|jgi:osmotically-inducible protein OsmY|nr:BON domain-containing protein [Gemmatimonadales bacterium]